MSSLIETKRITPIHIRQNKGAEEPLVCLTAYGAPIARILDPICDMILIGDSLGMVVYGMESTLPVKLKTMIEHGKAVVNVCNHACVVVDMPFGTYQESKEQAFRNCAKVLAETGASAVKIEGGKELSETIDFLVKRGIPVVSHIGLMPQHHKAKGGYKIQGKTLDSSKEILEDAVAVSEAGAFAVVLEGLVSDLATEITEKISVPTIGIGASPECDGQILVTDDLLGLSPAPYAKFVKKYANVAEIIENAVKAYAQDVRKRAFPSDEHVYKK